MKTILRHIKLMGIVYRYKLLMISIYRGNFITNILIQLGHILIQILFLSVTIGRIGQLERWSFGIVLATYGFFQMSVGAYSVFFSHIVNLPESLAFDGELDQYLVRPYSVLFQLTLGSLSPQYIFNILIGFLIFWQGVIRTDVEITILFWGKFALALTCATIILGAIFISLCSIAFWVNDRLSIQMPLNQLLQMARYPVTIYNGPIATILTWVLPLAFVGFLPVLMILSDSRMVGLYTLLPAVAIVWLLLALAVWRKGLSKYASVS